MARKKINIQNFRSIHNKDIEIKEFGGKFCQMFFGINETGKSNILKAVRLFDEYWGKGLLCPDQVVIDLVQTILPKPNYILDGFPRTVPQAEFLDTHSRPERVFYLRVGVETLVKRMKERAKIESRPDDRDDVYERRVKGFYADTHPVITSYREQHRIFEINGEREIDAVNLDLVRMIRELS